VFYSIMILAERLSASSDEKQTCFINTPGDMAL
jgi:hypothetical protein